MVFCLFLLGPFFVFWVFLQLKVAPKNTLNTFTQLVVINEIADRCQHLDG